MQDGQRHQDVIPLRAREIDVDILAVAHAAEVLEIADAILVENDPSDGQLRRSGLTGSAFFHSFAGCGRFGAQRQSRFLLSRPADEYTSTAHNKNGVRIMADPSLNRR